MQVRLKILQGSNAGKEIKLPAPKCVIGRGDDCHLRPQSDAISRRHCVIITTENEAVVRDLDSRALTVSALGRRDFKRYLGLEVPWR